MNALPKYVASHTLTDTPWKPATILGGDVLGQGRRYYYDDGPALGMRVTDHTVTPGGLTILVLEATGPAAVATYDGVGSVGA